MLVCLCLRVSGSSCVPTVSTNPLLPNEVSLCLSLFSLFVCICVCVLALSSSLSPSVVLEQKKNPKRESAVGHEVPEEAA